MKLSYVLAAILACSFAGALIASRGGKTLCLVLTGALSIYGLARLIG